jgi:hypothetical protein
LGFKRRKRSFTETPVGRDATPDAGEDARTTPADTRLKEIFARAEIID